ncbi:MAG: hypothetical protein H7A24_01070 [Leptospiraceae bacterium]|nr:hypothetical protein [Leptospiraceae bacterium]MCP5510443.1 hypothetical protein [Leptospiraceae bacterium]
MKKKVIGSIILFLLVGFSWILSNRNDLISFPEIISSWYAKEYCSCYYVLKRDKDFCHNLVKQWISISEFEINEKEKMISVTGLGRKNSAKFIDPNLGCRFE